ncbi:hypothetical protein [Gluconobacter oxydans]|uniref:Uncharacterized protein n=1 Tax=Gluconobacter oxydans TaxID=442 RepID=A0AB35ARL9_GLUOY|nr:hypothetical protein [Gluconobacter oxydans]MBF0857374.1 hypothetical protein [Gluconobacter oxydans]
MTEMPSDNTATTRLCSSHAWLACSPYNQFYVTRPLGWILVDPTKLSAIEIRQHIEQNLQEPIDEEEFRRRLFRSHRVQFSSDRCTVTPELRPFWSNPVLSLSFAGLRFEGAWSKAAFRG